MRAPLAAMAAEPGRGDDVAVVDAASDRHRQLACQLVRRDRRRCRATSCAVEQGGVFGIVERRRVPHHGGRPRARAARSRACAGSSRPATCSASRSSSMDFLDGAATGRDDRSMSRRAGRGLRAPARRDLHRTDWASAVADAVASASMRRTPRSTAGATCTGSETDVAIPLLEEGAAWLHHHAADRRAGRHRARRSRARQLRARRVARDRLHRLGVRPPRRPDRGLGVPDHDARRVDDGPRRLARAVRARRRRDGDASASSTTGACSTSSRAPAPT